MRRSPRIAAIRNPAGLDLGARTAPEVAISILAEIIQVRPSQMLDRQRDTRQPVPDTIAPPPPTIAPSRGRITPTTDAIAPASDTVAPAPHTIAPGVEVDPVCGMDVGVAGARHTADVGGTMYYFCCLQCKTRFISEPGRYLASRP